MPETEQGLFVGPNVYSRFTEASAFGSPKQTILGLLKDNKQTVDELAKTMDADARDVQVVLDDLKTSDMVKVDGNGRYQLGAVRQQPGAAIIRDQEILKQLQPSTKTYIGK